MAETIGEQHEIPVTAPERVDEASAPARDGAPRRQRLLAAFSDFVSDTGGIDSWLTASMPEAVVVRLSVLDEEPLSKAQINELLVLSHEAGMSDGFFAHYWLTAPTHVYDVRSVPGLDEAWLNRAAIQSIEHLRWGLYRFYVDALLFFGNVRSAYRRLRDLDAGQLSDFFMERRVDTDALRRRGPALPLGRISRDDRYLISEMACKSFDPVDGDGDLRSVLQSAFGEHVRAGGGSITVEKLLSGKYVKENFSDRQQQLLFAADEVLDDDIETLQMLEATIHTVATRFEQARRVALENTNLYLARIEDLDAYVATSMRVREDFRDMARFCEEVFGDPKLRELDVRYFDPTVSAAAGHEDKGLIECLMVKCAKVLVYFAGTKDSYGKAAEAAMALALGKPVIFYCDEAARHSFYRDLHPLSRLIEFDTGVAVGAIVATSPREVSELLVRVLHNQMEYEIDQPKAGYLRLKERLTGSVVRLQTNDELIRETFWHYYHRSPASPIV